MFLSTLSRKFIRFLLHSDDTATATAFALVQYTWRRNFWQNAIISHFNDILKQYFSA